jgi:hypothetical protein
MAPTASQNGSGDANSGQGRATNLGPTPHLPAQALSDHVLALRARDVFPFSCPAADAGRRAAQRVQLARLASVYHLGG